MFANLFLFALLCVIVNSSEPECSSFHFVEKTLEKVIKTEMHVNQMKSEIEEKQESMSKTLDGMQTDWEKTKHDLISAMDNSRKTVDEMKTQLPDIPQVHSVAFHAHNIHDIEPDDGETLIFSTTTFDKGSGYNNKTGVYVTPVGGVYIFNVQLCITATRFLYFEIASGKGPILKGCFNDDAPNYSGCRTAIAVSMLDAKEKVWVKSRDSTSGSDFWKASDVWNSFSGVLISGMS